MSAKTQAKLEAQLAQRLAQVEDGSLPAREAFGTIEDWIMQLGERKAFLHPSLKQWMWYDSFHDEWVFAGCGVRQGILMVINKTGGIKKLPHEDDVSDWCVLVQDDQPYGPLHIEELRDKLQRGEIKSESLIWTTRANDWIPVTDTRIRNIIFGKDTTEI
jgi:hypothetical protein